jgi:hypothetical protein
MFRTAAGSTARLIQLCIGYFVFYVMTGVLVKYFIDIRVPPMTQMGYLVNNTIGGSALAMLAVILLGWLRLKSNRLVRWGPFQVPSEAAYIIPSGVCTAVVIPTTTLMYTLPISVMVAMVIMRGSVIVISRAVDAIQIRQGILTKRVYAEENWAVFFALLAVAVNVLLVPVVGLLESRGVPAGRFTGIDPAAGRGSFDFLGNVAAMTILSSYVVAYSFRIYIMNYFKNTRGKGVPQDNNGFFAIEQAAACATMVLGGLFIYASPVLLGWSGQLLMDFREGLEHPTWSAVLSGIPFGLVAFFSVFIFLFKGRTATFAGLVNRLTSLVAGTAATLLMHYVFGLALPSARDWLSLGFILVAVYFLTKAERLRVAEIRESQPVPAGARGAAPGLAPSPAGRR